MAWRSALQGFAVRCACEGAARATARLGAHTATPLCRGGTAAASDLEWVKAPTLAAEAARAASTQQRTVSAAEATVAPVANHPDAALNALQLRRVKQILKRRHWHFERRRRCAVSPVAPSAMWSTSPWQHYSCAAQ
jgi:hypothetical protein